MVGCRFRLRAMKILFIIIPKRFNGLVLLGFSLFEPCQSGNTAAIRLVEKCKQIAKLSKGIIDDSFGFVRGREVTIS